MRVRAKPYWMCTTCERFDAARGCAEDGCHGPVAGGWFPRYAGPLRAGGDHAHQWCFMCGVPAVAGVRVADRFFGVCAVHVNHLRTRVQRDGGTVRDVYGREQGGVWACRDDELRPEGSGEA